ncbi:MAG: hypothetical protein EBU90_31385, partial [Proteobacteria bacterium]|nr:hypothetical protein [Pseudomonadota bacterium]
AKFTDLIRQVTTISQLVPQSLRAAGSLPKASGKTGALEAVRGKKSPYVTQEELAEEMAKIRNTKVAALKDPAFIKGTPEYEKFIKGSYLSDAEKAAVHNRIKKLPKWLIESSVENTQRYLTHMAKAEKAAGIAPETSQTIRDLRELTRLKLIGLTPEELRNLEPTLKPIIRETKFQLAEDIIEALKSMPGALKGMVSEVIKSPFTEQEWAATGQKVENVVKSIGSTIIESSAELGAKLKTSIVESALGKTVIEYSEKLKLGVGKIAGVLQFLEKPLAALVMYQDYTENIEKKGKNLSAQLEGLQAGMIRWLTFGAADLKDVNDKTEKSLQAWQEGKYVEAYTREVTKLVDFALSMPNVAL